MQVNKIQQSKTNPLQKGTQNQFATRRAKAKTYRATLKLYMAFIAVIAGSFFTVAVNVNIRNEVMRNTTTPVIMLVTMFVGMIPGIIFIFVEGKRDLARPMRRIRTKLHKNQTPHN